MGLSPPNSTKQFYSGIDALFSHTWKHEKTATLRLESTSSWWCTTGSAAGIQNFGENKSRCRSGDQIPRSDAAIHLDIHGLPLRHYGSAGKKPRITGGCRVWSNGRFAFAVVLGLSAGHTKLVVGIVQRPGRCSRDLVDVMVGSPVALEMSRMSGNRVWSPEGMACRLLSGLVCAWSRQV